MIHLCLPYHTEPTPCTINVTTYSHPLPQSGPTNTLAPPNILFIEKGSIIVEKDINDDYLKCYCTIKDPVKPYKNLVLGARDNKE